MSIMTSSYTWLFVEKLIQANEETFKALLNWHFVL